MALSTRLFDEAGVDQVIQDRIDARRETQQAPGYGEGTPAPAPTDGQAPGPVSTPNENQGGEPRPPRPTPPPPPPVASSNMPDVRGSAATGGVQGSFAQAGTRGFQQRFGGNAPALWFRRALGAATPDVQRSMIGARSGGTTAGAAGPTPGQPTGIDAFGGGEGEPGGRPGDLEYQRFIQEVLSKMFRRG